ncbi:hypothetical protein [Acinetobacter higginsii]|uniref:hypothetical protein n=1 Tax=Acinetobacter higginsii TaxID=70347 RepID=UPI00300A23CB
MADQIITKEGLVNASKDANSLEVFMSGSDIQDVITRFGRQYPTLAKLVRMLMEIGGWKAYQTEAALKATTPIVAPSVGYAFDTKKLYLWNGTIWIDEGLSPLDQAKAYTDAIFANFTKFKNGLGTSLNFSPYLSFNDNINFGVTDKHGYRLDADVLLKVLSPTGEFKFIPYGKFDDSDSYILVDMNYRLLTVKSDTPPVVDEKIWTAPLYLVFDNTAKSIQMSWKHDDNLMLKAVWQPNGANSLFNFRAIYKANLGDPAKAVWTLIQQVNTDYIPPITHEATTGDVTPNVLTTGGNHLGKNGERTAYMQFCDFYLDDLKLLQNFTGYVESISVKWQNHIYAGNTVTQQRVTTQQDVFARFYARCVEVDCEVTALEPIKIWRDGGAQLVGQGWDESYHFLGGIQKERLAANSGVLNGGKQSEAPYQWGVTLKSPELGYCAAFIDRFYGVKFDAVASDDTPMTKNNSSYKFYNFVIKNEATQYPLPTGASYKWRGGYAYAPITIVENLDSAFIFKQAGRTRLGVANTASQVNGTIHINSLCGTDFETAGSIGVNGLDTTFSQYHPDFFKELN